MIDRKGLLKEIGGAKLDLGCGRQKRGEEYIGVDALDIEGVDLVGDVLEVLAAIPDGVIEEVFASHFLEHVDDVEGLLLEIARVVRVGGKVEIVVPHFSNAYFYSDLTHLHPFGLYSFAYLLPDSPFRRQVPSYGTTVPFGLDSVRLEFKSPRPFFVRYALKRTIQIVVNLSRWSQEFYEENLAFVLPCYQIRFELRRSG